MLAPSSLFIPTNNNNNNNKRFCLKRYHSNCLHQRPFLEDFSLLTPNSPLFQLPPHQSFILLAYSLPISQDQYYCA
ncbi:hypothetical protein QVD17_25318 [Tagetes erecta]|uniref:Uncharacterized protein n=1 Tax=Tagetes erecta TaxID=13708 RepID=A0AAD8KFX3_TARER|nr:hypothetical protein QVD17_25318 [Tagetes erecta]